MIHRAEIRRFLVPVILLVVLVGGCGSSGSSPQESSSPAASGVSTEPTGVTVDGEPGAKPTLTVPDGPAPTDLRAEVLSEGDGATVAAGETLVVDYLGQTWEPKDGAPNVFDNSYDRGAPAGFPIGVGRVIPGWDTALVGQKVGARVLLSVPPEQAYGADSSEHELGGQTLLFVVDLLGALAATTTAPGTAVESVPDGFPQVDGAPGEEPTVTSVEGVTAGEASRSALLVSGTGEEIASEGVLAMQVVQTDTATGQQTQSTWSGSGVEILPTEQVLTLADVLQGQKVGSRAVVVTPDDGQGSFVLVIDVVAQFASA